MRNWSLSKKILVGTVAAGALFAGVGVAVSIPTAVVTYELVSDKIANPLRLVVVSDLHSCYYGENQQDLIQLIEAQKPDAILFPGDIIDDEEPNPQNALDVLSWAGAHYPSYYVTGNHEFRIGDIQWVYDAVADCGVTVLRGTGKTLEIGENILHTHGVDDPKSGVILSQLSTLSTEDGYNILIAHRPEGIDRYRELDFDLVVSGHAHGGQWRVPGLINGILAPNQGLFPQYAGGLYQFKEMDFVVSRGLARESTRIPRMYNPPELVVIDLVPEN